MFTGCGSLEAIYATSFRNRMGGGSSMLYGCPKLVGGTDCFVPTNSTSCTALKLGAGGVLTNPEADAREWCYMHLLQNGAVYFSADSELVDPSACVCSGRLCVNARYNAVGVIPGYGHRADMRLVVFMSGMARFSRVNMDYWFYGLSALTGFSMFWNLKNVASMKYAFASCTGLTELDMTGLDPSGLTDLGSAFSGCANLRKIVVDSSWALPAGVSGAQTFYGCTSLVGGNGTVY